MTDNVIRYPEIYHVSDVKGDKQKFIRIVSTVVNGPGKYLELESPIAEIKYGRLEDGMYVLVDYGDISDTICISKSKVQYDDVTVDVGDIKKKDTMFPITTVGENKYVLVVNSQSQMNSFISRLMNSLIALKKSDIYE